MIDTPPETPRRVAIADRLAAFDSVVEIGVGRRPDLTAALADRGVAVTATDVVERTVPDPVTFALDDVTDPDRSVYADADALVARHLPPELHRPARDLARDLGVPLYFTTLGGDQPAVPVEREALPEGGTLYRAVDRGEDSEPDLEDGRGGEKAKRD